MSVENKTLVPYTGNEKKTLVKNATPQNARQKYMVSE
jgi:hypothetical protein